MKDSRGDHQEVLPHGDHSPPQRQRVIRYQDHYQSIHLECEPKVQLKNYEMYESPLDKREIQSSS